MTRLVEARTGWWSIKKFVRTTRRYRNVQIRLGEHTLRARTPTADLRDALVQIN